MPYIPLNDTFNVPYKNETNSSIILPCAFLFVISGFVIVDNLDVNGRASVVSWDLILEGVSLSFLLVVVGGESASPSLCLCPPPRLVASRNDVDEVYFV